MMMSWCFLLCLIVGVRTSAPPHIVFFLADDLGWNDVSFHGSKQIPTPNIDLLARSGIILNNYYVSPICTPSRSALLTGKHPIHTGLQHQVIYPSHPYGLPLNDKLLPEWLSHLGYTSYATGKWHLGFFRHEYTPTYRGFKSFRGFWTGSEDYYSHARSDYGNEKEFAGEDNSTKKMWGYDFRRNMEVDYESRGRYSTDVLTDEAIRVIRSHNASTPMFLYVAYQSVHIPYQAPQETIDKFNYIQDKRRRTYAAMAFLMDKSIGRVMTALYESGKLTNTVVAFSTDNGGPASTMGSASNWPLRGVKSTLWEGGVRGAGFLWSSQIHSRVSSQLMHIQDWLPTLYSAAGGNAADLGNIDGVSLWESITNNTPSPRSHLLHNIDDILLVAAVRVGGWKLVIGSKHNGSFDGWYGPSGRNCTICGYMTRQMENECEMKQILQKINKTANHYRKDVQVSCGDRPANASTNCKPTEKPCLFNIIKDPCEFVNVAQENQHIVRKLQDVLMAYNKTAVPPRNKPSDPRADPRFFNHVWTNWMG